MIDLSALSFDGSRRGDVAETFLANIPAGLTSRQSLFGVLSRELLFPEYFGHNWDALSDCRRDLSWIRERRVIVSHEDLPVLPEKGDRLSISTSSRIV